MKKVRIMLEIKEACNICSGVLLIQLRATKIELIVMSKAVALLVSKKAVLLQSILKPKFGLCAAVLREYSDTYRKTAKCK